VAAASAACVSCLAGAASRAPCEMQAQLHHGGRSLAPPTAAAEGSQMASEAIRPFGIEDIADAEQVL
jgi:hypothetical protein